MLKVVYITLYITLYIIYYCIKTFEDVFSNFDMTCIPPVQLVRVKNFRKVFAGGRGGHEILNEYLKLHIPSIKSIFIITNLIYFRCNGIWKYPLICFTKYTTLRFLVCPFFIFQIFYFFALSILYVKHPPAHKHNNQQCNIKAIVKKKFQSMLNLELLDIHI